MSMKPALLGGEKLISQPLPRELFTWPILNAEMDQAILDVLHNRKMSGLDITRQFEQAFADWHGVKYGLGCPNGTAALQCALYGAGVGSGDEVICSTCTFWASITQVYSLRATVRFADIVPETLCIDPDYLEKLITPRTKAVMAVHVYSMPAEMDQISAICRKHRIKLIEDCSHSHGALYKGKITGSLGDAAGFSIMTGKSFACGEGGIMLTDDREIYERAILFGHARRHSEDLQLEAYKIQPGKLWHCGIPWGGIKGRLNQFTSALGLVQLKKYPAEMAEIQAAMNYFSDLIDEIPGLKSIRPADARSTKGGWYASHMIYDSAALNGLSVTAFYNAISAEGIAGCYPYGYRPLHLHPLFQTIDVFNEGRPTRLSCLPEGIDIRENPGDLPLAERIGSRVMLQPQFKKFDKKAIELYVSGFRKIAEYSKELLSVDKGNPQEMGKWFMSAI
ncbi:MAG: DegT/DnrJ/EryC1/StrS family aminotransferase [Victivallaceae bacterium]|nr:DegT/DnrJ/EryC1/StrS family aminotransferase [Victivallaceae bacterium]